MFYKLYRGFHKMLIFLNLVNPKNLSTEQMYSYYGIGKHLEQDMEKRIEHMTQVVASQERIMWRNSVPAALSCLKLCRKCKKKNKKFLAQHIKKEK